MKATRKKRSYTHLTEKDFNNVKLLIQAGLSYKQINDLTGRSQSTVAWIKQSETFEEYKKKIEQINLRKPSNEQLVSHTPIAIQAGLDEDLFKVLANIQDSLRDINDKIKWLADNKVIEVAPKKFGIF